MAIETLRFRINVRQIDDDVPGFHAQLDFRIAKGNVLLECLADGWIEYHSWDRFRIRVGRIARGQEREALLSDYDSDTAFVLKVEGGAERCLIELAAQDRLSAGEGASLSTTIRSDSIPDLAKGLDGFPRWW